tara:strand:+ start:196 stop:807 length:612 start_codon:yes stop_codon:yes gene_type:complete
LANLNKKISPLFISMNLPLSYSIIEETNKVEKKVENKSKNKTIKKRNFLNSLKNLMHMEKEEDDDEVDLADFKPLPNPENTSVENEKVDESDESVSKEGFNSLDPSEVANNQYYSSVGNGGAEQNNLYATNYIPYYTELNNSKEVLTDEGSLMKKLNYMIHLLEEQQEQKTDNVTEELVLYTFLGVFVIFVVDSFARAGKYTR